MTVLGLVVVITRRGVVLLLSVVLLVVVLDVVLGTVDCVVGLGKSFLAVTCLLLKGSFITGFAGCEGCFLGADFVG